MRAVKDQKKYNLKIQIEYLDVITKKIEYLDIKAQHIAKYAVTKDSINFNYNLHLLSLNSINNSVLRILKFKDTRIIIDLQEDDISISKKRFIVIETEKSAADDNMMNLDLLITTEMTYDFINFNRFANISKDADFITSFDLMQKIFKEINKMFGSDISIHYNDSGTVGQLYPSMRLQDDLKDTDIFDFIFKEFPPYLLNPYFLYDDLHFGSKTPYNIFVFNLSNLGGSYQLKDIAKIPNYDRASNFVGKTDLVDHVRIDYKLKSTLILWNKNDNKKGVLTPSDKRVLKPEVITIDTTLDVSNFKKRLYMLKKLSDYKSTTEKYIYNRINIEDISFGNIYNITTKGIYDHLPLTIEYTFIRNKSESFDLDVGVEFAKVPQIIS